MKIPFKPSMLTVRRKLPKWIIIHHTAEMYEVPEARIDNQKYQLPGIFNGVLEKKQGDVNYHYIIERVKEDYIPICCRPFVYMCEWDDIHPDINQRAIHVALLGNYDFKVPEKRCYEVLAYRLLNPFMNMYHITPDRIKFHNEVSDIKDLSCPGVFLDMVVIESMVRRYVIK